MHSIGYPPAWAGTGSRKADETVTQLQDPKPSTPLRARLGSKTMWISGLIIALMLGWIVYLIIGIAADDSIRSASSVRQLAEMTERNLREQDGKSLQTHFVANTISMDYGSDFVDKLEEGKFTNIRVRAHDEFVEVTGQGPNGQRLCTAWDVEESEDGTYLLDPTPSTQAEACRAE